jgi:hypothetical protein
MWHLSKAKLIFAQFMEGNMGCRKTIRGQFGNILSKFLFLNVTHDPEILLLKYTRHVGVYAIGHLSKLSYNMEKLQ